MGHLSQKSVFGSGTNPENWVFRMSCQEIWIPGTDPENWVFRISCQVLTLRLLLRFLSTSLVWHNPESWLLSKHNPQEFRRSWQWTTTIHMVGLSCLLWKTRFQLHQCSDEAGVFPFTRNKSLFVEPSTCQATRTTSNKKQARIFQPNHHVLSFRHCWHTQSFVSFHPRVVSFFVRIDSSFCCWRWWSSFGTDDGGGRG